MSVLGFDTFEALYKSDAQGLAALVVIPCAFLAFLLLGPRRPRSKGVVPDMAPFVRVYAIVFSVETILDPVATGLLPRMLGIAEAPIATGILVFFVLLGDFRVFLLLFRLARPSASLAAISGESAAWTLVVPVVAAAANAGLTAAIPDLPSQSIWLVYELSFAGLAVFLRFFWLPGVVAAGARRGYLEDVLEYALAYYLLWAAADMLILLVHLDLGWALRVIPNQLYYSLYLPFVYLRFHSPGDEKA